MKRPLPDATTHLFEIRAAIPEAKHIDLELEHLPALPETAAPPRTQS